MTDDKTHYRSVQDFFDNEYLGYARYTVEHRAIPSAIDGFKPTQRKVACAANRHWKTGNEKSLKVFQLAGNVASTTFYHHGNASLESCIIGMAQEFKNSMPIFQGVGQFGSLRSPEAGAPRYVGVKFNDNFRLLYKDFELVSPLYEDGEEIEPKFFLPIIPTVLLNGSSGIAVGFASNILNRNPRDLIDACLDYLQGKKVKTLVPWLKEFNGVFTRDPLNPKSWSIRGTYDVKNSSTIEVTEIPPSYTYEKYESHLNKLVEQGKIASYDDMSAGKVCYVVKFQRQKMSDLLDEGKIEDTLKLIERETENFTTLDHEGKLRIFETAESIVEYFVEVRLGYYDLRKQRLLKTLADELIVLSNRARFIKAVIEGEVVVAGQKKAAVEQILAEKKFDKVDGKNYDYLLGLAIHTLTKEKYDDLVKRENEKRKELRRVEETAPKTMYLQDLQELRRKISG